MLKISKLFALKDPQVGPKTDGNWFGSKEKVAVKRNYIKIIRAIEHDTQTNGFKAGIFLPRKILANSLLTLHISRIKDLI